MIDPRDEGPIQDTLRGFPRRELIRSRGKAWTIEHLDYALTRGLEETDASQKANAEKFLLELRADRARELEEQQAAERHAKLEASIESLRAAVAKGPKPHWSASPGFWVAVVAALAASVAAWPVVAGWCL